MQTVGRRHKLFAPHHFEQVEHVLIEHIPRADLLLDHVKAGLRNIESGLHGGWAGKND